MFRLVYEKRVFKDLDKIPNADVERIVNLFKKLSADPTLPGSKRLSGHAGLYRVRQGDYRIIYSIALKEKWIKIILVRHRKDVYRQL